MQRAPAGEGLESGLSSLHGWHGWRQELSDQWPAVKLSMPRRCALLCVQVIATSTAEAEAKQKAAQDKEAALSVESVQIAQDKLEAEQALSEAIPALEEAAAALNDLKRDDITEIRTFAKPAIYVQKVGNSAVRMTCVVLVAQFTGVAT